MVLGNALSFSSDRERLVDRRESLEAEAATIEVEELDLLLMTVPPESRVATDYRLIADLADRAVLWNVAHLYMDDAPPPHWEGDWPLTLDLIDTVVLPLDDPFLSRLGPEWGEPEQGGGYGVWVREG
jgi:hypothetical protein